MNTLSTQTSITIFLALTLLGIIVNVVVKRVRNRRSWKRNLRAALRSNSSQAKKEAVHEAVEAGLSVSGSELLEVTEHEGDLEVLDFLACEVSTRAWEPGSKREIVALRLWAKEHQINRNLTGNAQSGEQGSIQEGINTVNQNKLDHEESTVNDTSNLDRTLIVKNSGDLDSALIEAETQINQSTKQAPVDGNVDSVAVSPITEDDMLLARSMLDSLLPDEPAGAESSQTPESSLGGPVTSQLGRRTLFSRSMAGGTPSADIVSSTSAPNVEQAWWDELLRLEDLKDGAATSEASQDEVAEVTKPGDTTTENKPDETLVDIGGKLAMPAEAIEPAASGLAGDEPAVTVGQPEPADLTISDGLDEHSALPSDTTTGAQGVPDAMLAAAMMAFAADQESPQDDEKSEQPTSYTPAWEREVTAASSSDVFTPDDTPDASWGHQESPAEKLPPLAALAAGRTEHGKGGEPEAGILDLSGRELEDQAQSKQFTPFADRVDIPATQLKKAAEKLQVEPEIEKTGTVAVGGWRKQKDASAWIPGVLAHTVLVTGAGGPAGVCVIENLKARGFDVIAADANNHASGFSLGDAAVVIPKATGQSFATAVITAAQKHNATAVISTVAEEMEALSSSMSLFEKARIAIWLPHQNTVDICLDKWKFAQVMARADVPAPLCNLHTGNGIEGPWVVKPRMGRGSRGVHVVETARQLGAALELVEDAVVQELIEGREFTADVLVDRGGAMVGCVTRWRNSTKGGISVDGETFKLPGTTQTVSQALAAVDYQGVANVQGFVTDDGATVIVEINPRFSGGLELSLAADSDLVVQYLRAVCGLGIEEENLDYHSGVSMRRFLRGVIGDDKVVP